MDALWWGSTGWRTTCTQQAPAGDADSILDLVHSLYLPCATVRWLHSRAHVWGREWGPAGEAFMWLANLHRLHLKTGAMECLQSCRVCHQAGDWCGRPCAGCAGGLPSGEMGCDMWRMYASQSLGAGRRCQQQACQQCSQGHWEDSPQEPCGLPAWQQGPGLEAAAGSRSNTAGPQEQHHMPAATVALRSPQPVHCSSSCHMQVLDPYHKAYLHHQHQRTCACASCLGCSTKTMIQRATNRGNAWRSSTYHCQAPAAACTSAHHMPAPPCQQAGLAQLRAPSTHVKYVQCRAHPCLSSHARCMPTAPCSISLRGAPLHAYPTHPSCSGSFMSSCMPVMHSAATALTAGCPHRWCP